MHPTCRMVENVFEELDSPGEWYYSKEEKQLYFWPEDHLKLTTSKIEVATQKQLINIMGTKEDLVENFSIEGMRFEHTKRTIMEDYEPLLRSDWTMYRGAAIFLEGTKNTTIAHCELTNFRGNAIFVSGFNRNAQIKNNHIYNCGASAVSFVGFPDAVRSPSFQYDPVFNTTDKGYGNEKVKGRETEISPCHQVKRNLPPMLNFHGGKDLTVPIENAERFTRLMKEANNDCRLIKIKGVGHGFFNGDFFRKGKGDKYFNLTMYDTDAFLSDLGFLKGEPTINRNI